MRIIRPGVGPNQEVLQGECNNCHCIVKVTAAEATTSADQREPGQYVQCPTDSCRSVIWLHKVKKAK